MKLVKHLVFGTLLLLANVGVAKACSGPPEPLYAPPPYIDPGYAPIDWTDVDYGPTAKFVLLLRDYTNKQNIKTENAQNFIEQQEKENTLYTDAVTELLKTKNIDLAIIDPKNLNGCGSNNHENALLFMRTVFNDPSVTNGFSDFVKIRHRMLGLCGRENREAVSTELSSEIAQLQQKDNRGYADYLAVLQILYSDTGDIGGSKLPEALTALRKIQEKAPHAKWWNKYIGSQPQTTWLDQTASYLIARLQLIMSQKDWDGESEPPVVNKEQLQAAKTAFADYLRNYPNGIYVDSAKNIQRKILYLESDHEALNKAIESRINESFNRQHFSSADLEKAFDIFAEYKHYYQGDVDISHDAPLVVAYGVFKAENIAPAIFEQLQARKNDFSAYPGLFRFLQAYILYRQGDYAKLLDLTPAEPVTIAIVSLSTEAMRARAFEASGKKDQALQAWQNVAAAIHDDQSQLHIGGIYISNKDTVGLFGEKSGLSNDHILSDLATFGLSNDQLWGALKASELKSENRLIVEKSLFQRLLLQRNYSDIEKLLQQSSHRDIFKDIANDIMTLSHNPEDSASLVEIGAYMYGHYLRPNSSIYGEYSPFSSDVLKELQPVCTSCQAVQNAIPPMASFLKAEETMQNNRQNADVEAEDLHFLVKCFHQSEFADRCQWGQNFDNQGKAWFELLHKKYPRSEWAKRTPYYY